ncbi:MAG TPA: sodium:alanine symporter family protein [Firmicutes bacterium]|nr:sodium:alanine symporter family protein [Bacillota bacterium]
MELLINFSNFLWGWPLVIFMLIVAVALTVATGAVQFRQFGYMLRTTFGKLFDKSGQGEGTIHPYQAAMASIAGTVGIGNIAGVGLAIGLGGPGALFWLWVVSIFSMITKYSEVVLGVHYREKDPVTGEYQSGPMYYITKGLGSNWKWLAVLYAFMFGITYLVYSFVQSNTIAVAMTSMVGLEPLYTGIILAVLASFVVFGGLQGLAKTAEKLVPIMTIIYFVSALIIIIGNIGRLPEVLASVFTQAFTGSAAIGGFAGSTVLMAVRHGFTRGVFSNDGGLGLGAVLHGTAITTHPAKQGMWGIFEVFLDTDLVCTSTALVILFSGVLDSGLSGLDLTSLAFATGLPTDWLGSVLICISVVLFGFTTILADIYYCDFGLSYVFKKLRGKKFSNVIRVLCLIGIVWGAVGGLSTVWGLADLVMAILIIINLPVVLAQVKTVGRLTKEFFGSGMHKKELEEEKARKAQKQQA